MVGKILEVYPRKIIRNEAVREPYFEVRSKEFTRTLFIQRGRPDVLVDQVIKPGVTYMLQSDLPQQAINSRSQLQDAIYQSPPS
ncbi:hypothetical protein F2Q70_00006655 [Brassica cretica]|nr:hypothetical protein F2Q70_00006655 [Brassica cretica]